MIDLNIKVSWLWTSYTAYEARSAPWQRSLKQRQSERESSSFCTWTASWKRRRGKGLAGLLQIWQKKKRKNEIRNFASQWDQDLQQLCTQNYIFLFASEQQEDDDQPEPEGPEPNGERETNLAINEGVEASIKLEETINDSGIVIDVPSFDAAPESLTEIVVDTNASEHIQHRREREANTRPRRDETEALLEEVKALNSEMVTKNPEDDGTGQKTAQRNEKIVKKKKRNETKKSPKKYLDVNNNGNQREDAAEQENEERQVCQSNQIELISHMSKRIYEDYKSGLRQNSNCNPILPLRNNEPFSNNSYFRFNQTTFEERGGGRRGHVDRVDRTDAENDRRRTLRLFDLLPLSLARVKFERPSLHPSSQKQGEKTAVIVRHSRPVDHAQIRLPSFHSFIHDSTSVISLSHSRKMRRHWLPNPFIFISFFKTPKLDYLHRTQGRKQSPCL